MSRRGEDLKHSGAKWRLRLVSDSSFSTCEAKKQPCFWRIWAVAMAAVQSSQRRASMQASSLSPLQETPGLVSWDGTSLKDSDANAHPVGHKSLSATWPGICYSHESGNKAPSRTIVPTPIQLGTRVYLQAQNSDA